MHRFYSIDYKEKLAMQGKSGMLRNIFCLDRGTTRCSIRLPGLKLAEMLENGHGQQGLRAIPTKKSQGV
jgi:hypothetical protein